jgi:hypothetical protein
MQSKKMIVKLLLCFLMLAVSLALALDVESKCVSSQHEKLTTQAH